MTHFKKLQYEAVEQQLMLLTMVCLLQSGGSAKQDRPEQCEPG